MKRQITYGDKIFTKNITGQESIHKIQITTTNH